MTAGEPATCVFAPGSVRLHLNLQTTPTSAVNRWTGTVSMMDPVPGGVRLFAAEHPEIAVDCPSTTALTLGIRPGVQLAFSIDADDVSVRRSR
ncbi:hypothetical protein [Microbacterium sp. CH12i]|uniref:hypothetical protein n=1 Tax=Microbacterium sp. CH12i TaxID=1479651 RepID=UPI000AE3EB05|nr:hypothetical protein [Microbacterium sp. CH12i]